MQTKERGGAGGGGGGRVVVWSEVAWLLCHIF
jgi:hypothetical protein